MLVGHESLKLATLVRSQPSVPSLGRRGFLGMLGLGAAGAVLAPAMKTYGFFGGILRPRPEIMYYTATITYKTSQTIWYIHRETYHLLLKGVLNMEIIKPRNEEHTLVYEEHWTE